MEATQVTWRLDTAQRQVSGVLNSLEPLTMRQWQERIEAAVADAVDAGDYDITVIFEPFLPLKWHVQVRRFAAITPF